MFSIKLKLYLNLYVENSIGVINILMGICKSFCADNRIPILHIFNTAEAKIFIFESPFQKGLIVFTLLNFSGREKTCSYYKCQMVTNYLLYSCRSFGGKINATIYAFSHDEIHIFSARRKKKIFNKNLSSASFDVMRLPLMYERCAKVFSGADIEPWKEEEVSMLFA